MLLYLYQSFKQNYFQLTFFAAATVFEGKRLLSVAPADLPVPDKKIPINEDVDF